MFGRANNGACYTRHDRTNLEGKWPSDNEKCAHRYMTLAEAQLACSAEPKCDGITVDGGLECHVERGEYASTYPDGLSWQFPYSLRSRPSKAWPSAGINSYLKNNEKACSAPPAEQPACPVRSAEAVKRTAATSTDESNERPKALAHAAELERRSAAEAAAIDASEVAHGTCPSASSSSSQHDGGSSSSTDDPSLPTACGSSISLLEQLRQLASLPGGGDDDCTYTRQHDCALTHYGRPDGWGGQHFRRIRAFLAAVQLGCSYLHVPLFPMNKNSQEHKLSHTSGERFFGLSDHCPNHRSGRMMGRLSALHLGAHCLSGFGNAPVDVQPFHTTHALSAVCNTTVSGLLKSWHKAANGHKITCEEAPRVPPLSRCAMLRATAALRRRYYAAHGGAPPLPWFSPAAADASSSSSSGRALPVHVAVHVRRGDLHQRDMTRWLSNSKLSRALTDLVGALTEVRARWEAGVGGASASSATPRLEMALHVMTESDWSKSERLPRRQWHTLCQSANITFHAHIDTDPLTTMHHLIHADVLLKSISGFSDVAASYTAGVKLYFFPSPETIYSSVGPLQPVSNIGPLGLRDGGMRQRFVCLLLSHLRHKAVTLSEPPPQALRMANGHHQIEQAAKQFTTKGHSKKMVTVPPP